jgi:hypothetical protein
MAPPLPRPVGAPSAFDPCAGSFCYERGRICGSIVDDEQFIDDVQAFDEGFAHDRYDVPDGSLFVARGNDDGNRHIAQ